MSKKVTMSFSFESEIASFINLQHAQTGVSKSDIVADAITKAASNPVKLTPEPINYDEFKNEIRVVIESCIASYFQTSKIPINTIKSTNDFNVKQVSDNLEEMIRRLLQVADSIEHSESKISTNAQSLLSYSKSVEQTGISRIEKITDQITGHVKTVKTVTDNTGSLFQKLSTNIVNLNTSISDTGRNFNRQMIRSSIQYYMTCLIGLMLVACTLFASFSLKLVYIEKHFQLVGLQNLRWYMIPVVILMIVIAFITESISAKSNRR